MRKWFANLCALLLLGGFCPRASGAYLLGHTRLDHGHWQVWLAEADGKNPRALTRSSWDKRSLRAMPGKSEILLRDNEGQVYRLDIKDPGKEAKTELGFEVVKDFDFHPQAGWLVAAYAPNALDNVCIWHVPAQGGQKRLLIPDPYLNETPRWAGGEKSFLFVKGHDGSSLVFCGKMDATVDLWLCSDRAHDVRLLYGGSGLEAEPAWSPDGAWIYFATWHSGNFRVARIRPNGKDFGLVSPEGTDCRCPVLVPDIGGQHD
jgi:Tol biopolymer transport system component